MMLKRKEQLMQRWECYRIQESVDNNGRQKTWLINSQQMTVPSFEGLINQMGGDGWELVGFGMAGYANERGIATIKEWIFKRPRP